ncbi:MAG: hypothetical protein LW650_10455 [Planctomycetaceae bacterium]|jgi:hypothetical protein|nr:hypothetical protein [Phycisphaerales bacterium]MCE2653875.1 hypothetical protein [Planctomycetaceae bacterium]
MNCFVLPPTLDDGLEGPIVPVHGGNGVGALGVFCNINPLLDTGCEDHPDPLLLDGGTSEPGAGALLLVLTAASRVSEAGERGGVARAVVWSGTLGSDLFEPDIRTWGPAGRARFAAMIRGPVRRLLGNGGEVRLALRPHARHVLSDANGCAALFAGGDVPAGLEVLADPAAMFTASMLRYAEDHLTRMFAVFGHLARAGRLAGVVLANVQHPPDATGPEVDGATADFGPPLKRTAFFDGLLPAETIVRLWRTHLPADLPVVLEADRAGVAAEKLAGLAAAGGAPPAAGRLPS